MSRPMRRYMEKFEALDLSAGTYHARKLPRGRCTHRDFLEYLNAYTETDFDLDWVDMILEKELD